MKITALVLAPFSKPAPRPALSTMVAAAAACLTMAATPAHAATVILNLSGNVSDGYYFTQDDGTTHYDRWSLPLSGLDAGNAVTVTQGDTIEATITLDQSFTIPASVNLTDFLFYVTGASFPAGNTASQGTTTFFLGNTQVATDMESVTTSGQLANTASFFPPNNGPITFDKVTSNFTITDLSAPATLDSASIGYVLFSPSTPVPEPGISVLMLAGLWTLGSSTRRRQ